MDREPAAGKPGRFHVTTPDFAAVLGVHHNTVALWIRDGMPSFRDGRQQWVDLTVGIPWVRALDKAELAAYKARTGGDARARKEEAMARLREMEVAEKEGRLVSREQFDREQAEIADAVREGVLGVAASAVQAGLISPAAEATLDEMLRDALRAIAAKAGA